MLNKKVIIVTGGAGYLGRVFIKAIVENSGIAVIADNNVKGSEDVLLELQKIYPEKKIDFVETEITSKNSITSLIEYVVKKYQKIDAIVNNAYPRNNNYGRDFFDVEFSDFCENINMHLGGYFLITQQICQFFKRQGYGNVVNISSVYGVIPPRFEIYQDTSMTMPIEYAVVKSALLHMTLYLAKYFSGCNIRINAISPGGVYNKQSEVFVRQYNSYCLNKGMLAEEDIVGTLLFLLSDVSKCINGQNIVVDDGFSL